MRRHYTAAVRTVFAFPAASREETAGLLTEHLPRQSHPWVLNGALYVDIDDEVTGTLYRDWAPDELAALESAVGRRPGWAVQIDISGRVDGTPEVHQLLGLLLARGGVAFDDYTVHAWSLPETMTGSTVGGLRFFDFKAYHDERR